MLDFLDLKAGIKEAFYVLHQESIKRYKRPKFPTDRSFLKRHKIIKQRN